MNAKRRFPVMDEGFSISWDIVAPFEPQALKNHDQTLSRLAERGGLSALELWHVMNNKTIRFRDLRNNTFDYSAWARGLLLLEKKQSDEVRELVRKAVALGIEHGQINGENVRPGDVDTLVDVLLIKNTD